MYFEKEASRKTGLQTLPDRLPGVHFTAIFYSGIPFRAHKELEKTGIYE